MRGSESVPTSSPTISFSCDSTLRVRPLTMKSAPSKFDELLPPLQYRQILVVHQGPPDLLTLLLGCPPVDRGKCQLDRSPLPEILVVRLHDGDVLATKPILQRPQSLAFVLEAGAEGQLQLQPYGAEQRASTTTSGPRRSQRTPGRRPL